MSSFLKDIFRVGFANLVIIISSIATSVVTARYIGPEGNGIIAGLTVYPSLFMTIGSLGIRQSTAFYLGKGIYTEERIKTAITQIWTLTTFFSLVASYLLIIFFSKSGENNFAVVLSLIPVPFSLFITYNSGIFLGKNEIKEFNKVNWIPPVIIFLLTLIFLGVLSWGIEGALVGAIGGPFFMAMFMLFKNKFLDAFSLKFDIVIIKSMLSLGIVYAIALLVINLNYKVDVMLLDKLSTPYELGIYSKGAGIIQYLWQIPMVLSTIIFSRSASSKDEFAFSLKVAKLLRISLIIIGFTSLILFLFSDYIILLMYGKEFYGSISVLKILLPGVLLLTVFKVMNMDLAGKGKPWVSMKAMIPALLINIVLNIIWVREYGANGSSLASTLSYSIAAILFAYYYCKETNVTMRDLFFIKKSDFNIILQIILKFLGKNNEGNRKPKSEIL